MAWPVDGRGRTVPARSADALPAEQFQDELVETIVRTALTAGLGYGMPEGITQAQGRLFHATYLTHFSFFAWRFPSWLQAIGSQCPHQDVRRTIIEDCVDEEVGDVDADGRCHIDVLYEEAEACGVTREEISLVEPTPIVLASCHAFENFARTLGWETGMAALSALEIIQSEPAVKLRNKLLAEMFTPEQLAKAAGGRDSESLAAATGVDADKMVFAAIHAYKDQFHGGGELKLLVKYGVTREIQQGMLWGAKAGCSVYITMRQEIDRIARAAIGLGPRERMVPIGG
jgi:pyrroloquinoline quinone (PQQ) biosynthesis protein C